MSDKVKVWDLPVRLFHWLLVVGVASSWFTIEILEDVQLHFYSGYAVLTLLIFRLMWGFVGPYYSRFSRLLFAPSAVVQHIRSFRAQPGQSHYLGHNPLGSLAVIVLLGMLILQVGTGLFSTDDYYYGPLAGLVSSDLINRLTGLHHDNFEWLQWLIALHIIAILMYRLIRKERLTSAMVTGVKTDVDSTQAKPKVISDRLVLALILVLISAIATYAIVNWLAEPVPITDSYLY